MTMVFRDGINKRVILSLENYGEEKTGKNEVSTMSHLSALGVKLQVRMQNPQTGSRNFLVLFYVVWFFRQSPRMSLTF